MRRPSFAAPLRSEGVPRVPRREKEGGSVKRRVTRLFLSLPLSIPFDGMEPFERVKEDQVDVVDSTSSRTP
jgi:hypothetical protein